MNDSKNPTLLTPCKKKRQCALPRQPTAPCSFPSSLHRPSFFKCNRTFSCFQGGIVRIGTSKVCKGGTFHQHQSIPSNSLFSLSLSPPCFLSLSLSLSKFPCVHSPPVVAACSAAGEGTASAVAAAAPSAEPAEESACCSSPLPSPLTHLGRILAGLKLQGRQGVNQALRQAGRARVGRQGERGLLGGDDRVAVAKEGDLGRKGGRERGSVCEAVSGREAGARAAKKHERHQWPAAPSPPRSTPVGTPFFFFVLRLAPSPSSRPAGGRPPPSTFPRRARGA